MEWLRVVRGLEEGRVERVEVGVGGGGDGGRVGRESEKG